MLRTVICDHCGSETMKESGQINRARKRGAGVFCDRRCFGLSRRETRTKDELVEAKRLYDIEYRRKNRAMIKAKKAAYYQRTRDPEKEREQRKARMHLHVEYCRRPEYKAWKREYDKRYRAKRDYGEFWEAHIALVELEQEIRPHKYEAMIQNGTYGKAQRRKRECQTKLHSLPRI